MIDRAATIDLDADAHVAALERQISKLSRINAALMSRVERSTDLQGNAFSLFETAISLESKVRDRTADLERALSDLAATNAALAHARDAADSARRRLGDAIETINEGFALFDADDRLLLCNQTYRSLWPAIANEILPGVSFDEIANRIGETGSSLGAMIAPDRWISERVAQHQVAKGGHVIALADGRWIQVNERRTSEGGVVGVYTDITDIKADEARQRAREAAERAIVLQSTLDAIPQGVCVFDRDGGLLAWNGPLLALLKLNPARAQRQISNHQALVDWCKINLPRADATNTLGWINEGDDIPEVSQVRRLADGRSLEVRRLAMPGGGMVIGFDDVTDRLRAAEALERRVAERTTELRREVSERVAAEKAMREAKTAAEQANLSKTRFLAAASHDLLQPLNAARLFISALATRRLAAPNRTLVGQAASALDSIEYLLEALLEISKLDAGAITPEIADVPLIDVFSALRAEYALAAEEQRISLHVEPTDIWVRSDGRLLRRILQNFLSNAVRYTVHGEVRMSARCHDSDVHITIVDTGPGIDVRHHAEIFEEFRRLDGRNGPGIGLGLAIVQRAARMLGHGVHLKSAPGEGSAFTVVVPLAAIGVRPRASARTIGSRGIDARGILVIDNEQAILDGMRAVLEGWGCSVATALDEDAVWAAPLDDLASVDVILADYHLADGVTGDVAVGNIRQYLGRPIPAVIITADRTPALRDALTVRGLHVLQKPVKLAQLRALLAQLTGTTA